MDQSKPEGVRQSGSASVIPTKPKRWDQPFSNEMNDATVDAVLAYEPFKPIKLEYDECRRRGDQIAPVILKKAERKMQKLRDLIRYDCSLRRCRSGEILIREADYGTSAFFILKGAVQVIFTRLDSSLLGRQAVKRKKIPRLIAQLFRRKRGAEVRDTSKYPQFVMAKRRRQIIDSILPSDPPGMSFEEIIGKWPSNTLFTPAKQILESDLKAGVKYGQWSVTDEDVDDGSRRFYRSTNAGSTTESPLEILPSDEPELHLLEGYPDVLHGEDIKSVTQSVLEGEVTDDCFFGEIGALARIERKATVIAGRAERGDEDETHLILEARWQGFRDIMNLIPDIGETIRRRYRSNCKNRVLASGIFSVVQLDDKATEEIRASSAVQLYGDFEWSVDYEAISAKDPQERLRSEPIIAQEGQELDGVFILMSGFGRLSQRHGNGERTIGYIGPKSFKDWANHVGLREAYHNWANRAAGHEPVKLQHSLRAVGYALTVFVPSWLLEKYVFNKLPTEKRPPALDGKKGSMASAAVGTSRRPRGPDKTGLLEFLVESRVMNGMKTMAIDLDRCTRCDDCVRACAATHDNNPRFLRHGIQYEHYMIANACMHCADPVCMIGCPTGAIHRVREGLQVVINDLTCIGCAICANNCPYDNIRMVPIRSLEHKPVMDPAGKVWHKATKCDLCIDQLGGPACQRACPHDALVRIDTSEMGPLDAWIDR